MTNRDGNFEVYVMNADGSFHTLEHAGREYVVEARPVTAN